MDATSPSRWRVRVKNAAEAEVVVVAGDAATEAEAVEEAAVPVAADAIATAAHAVSAIDL